jgi:hypothetical protein
MVLQVRNNIIVIVWLVIVLLLFTGSCSNDKRNKISGVKISYAGNNVLNALLEVHTNDAQKAQIKYGLAGQKEKSFVSQTSERNTNHSFLLTNLKPGQQYVFNIITSGENSTETSRDYFFRTINYKGGIQDAFKVECADTSALPAVFREGYVMLNQREIPGTIFLVLMTGVGSSFLTMAPITSCQDLLHLY